MSKKPTKKPPRADRAPDSKIPRATPEQDEETRNTPMSEIHDLYCGDQNDDNGWQALLYSALRAKLGLEDVLPALPQELVASLDDDKPARSEAWAFLSVYGWLIAKGWHDMEDPSHEALTQRFHRTMYRGGRVTRVKTIYHWLKENPSKLPRAWRIYNLVSALQKVELTPETMESTWDGSQDPFPLGFPVDRMAWVRCFAGDTQPQKDAAKERGPASLRLPEIWVDPREGNTDDEKDSIRTANKRLQSRYLAVRFLLSRNFGIKSFPRSGEDFVRTALGSDGSTLREDHLLLVGVLGSLLSKNLDDPMLGRPPRARWPDDIVAQDDDKEPIVVARRFADGLVDAMQEYTSNVPLFAKAQALLAREGSDARQPTYTSSSR